jgi:hypothetical protein
LGANPLDDPEGEAEDEPTEEGVSMTNPLDVPEGEAEEEGADQQRVDEGTIKRMPQKMRNRIIKLRAKERLARNRVEKNLQKQAVCWQAIRTVEAAPSKGCMGAGRRPRLFRLGAHNFLQSVWRHSVLVRQSSQKEMQRLGAQRYDGTSQGPSQGKAVLGLSPQTPAQTMHASQEVGVQDKTSG